MILYDKLKGKYSKKELKEIFGDDKARRIWREERNIYIHSISNKIDLYSIGYSFEEFIQDYGNKYNYIKEIKMLYLIFMAGYNMNRLSKKYGLESQFYNMIRNGFDYNSTSDNIHLVFNLLQIEVDTSLFTVDVYNTHIELLEIKLI